MKSVIFGAGTWGKGLKKGLEKHYGVQIRAVFDNDESKWGEEIDGIAVSPPEKLIDMDFEKVFICVQNEVCRSEIEAQLESMRIAPEKIVVMATSDEYADAFIEVYDIRSLLQQNYTLAEGLSTMRKNLLSLQERLRKYETFNEWEYGYESFMDLSSEGFVERSRVMSHYIRPECKSLLDLGCGEMHIRKFLNSGVKYYGCDYKKRDEETIICDLAKGEFPSICVDTIFMAGVLGYLSNWRDVLKKCSQHCTQLVMSRRKDRNSDGPNCPSYQNIVDEMLQNGFRLADELVLWDKSVIFNFEKETDKPQA